MWLVGLMLISIVIGSGLGVSWHLLNMWQEQQDEKVRRGEVKPVAATTKAE